MLGWVYHTNPCLIVLHQRSESFLEGTFSVDDPQMDIPPPSLLSTSCSLWRSSDYLLKYVPMLQL